MPPTFKVSLTTTEGQAEKVAALLSESLDPPPAVSISESGDLRLLEAYFVERPDLDGLETLLRDGGLASGAAAGGLQLHDIPDENWVALVQRGLHPVTAGRFVIHGSHDRGARMGRRYAIEIDAGLAFGTAHHGTTRGCLIAIDRLAKRRHWRRVLDVGTGSGVLAIAAAKASGACVLASDIDPVAVAVARENIGRNGVSHAVRTGVGAGVDRPDIRRQAPFDLITANILAGPLIMLAPRLAKLAARGGHVVLSGLLDNQAREVRATYLRLGLTLETRLSLEGWTTLVLKRGGWAIFERDVCAGL
jgi:ribosomal protein L11 methyltransferase